MRSKLAQRSYLYISNGDGEPPSWDKAPESVKRSGLVWIAAPGKEKEWHTVTCSHCQTTFLWNSFRRRDREWCWSCDHYICDRCSAVRKVVGCKTFAAILDDTERLVRKTVGA